MPIWIAKCLALNTNIAMFAIRAGHARRCAATPVAVSRVNDLERFLVAFATLAYFLPLVWLVTPWLAFADFAPSPAAIAAGTVLMIPALWLFHRSHADLGTNWSCTLVIREDHRLITRGVYARMRHPMYAALLMIALAQALMFPNWIAGLAYLVAMTPLVGLRLAPEERMMTDRFGDEYRAYAQRTKRLVPGVW